MSDAPLSVDAAIDLLTHGDLDIEGRLRDASNATMLCVVTHGDVEAYCVYKPVAGERPLWDFPDGTLAGREYAAYLVSAATGWDVVPPTVLRDGPLGPGMCQLWIDETDQDDLSLLLGFVPAKRVPPGWHRIFSAQDERGRPFVLAHSDDPRLARMAVFDAIANNADRKGSHVIPTLGEHVYGVDHGICFHTEDKLRSVLWGWSGAPLPDDSLDVLKSLRARLDEGFAAELAVHLSPVEVATFIGRVDELLGTGCFPTVPDDRHAIPWPPI